MNQNVPSGNLKSNDHSILTDFKIDSSMCISVLSYLLDSNIITRATIQNAISHIGITKTTTKDSNKIQARKEGNEDDDDNKNDTNYICVQETQPQDQCPSIATISVVPVASNKSSKVTSSSTTIIATDTAAMTSSTAATVRTRHIALHLYYDGGKYSGLAENIGQTNDTSIERSVFLALQKANLIVSSSSRESCQYSRCGRTDKGVSACGQMIAFQLKSAFPIEATTVHASTDVTTNSMDHPSRITNDNLPKNSYETRSVWVPPKRRKNNNSDNNHSISDPYIQKCIKEYAYDKILNNLLPSDIRVLGWCPVSDTFSARFSCTTRTYRYFFVAPTTNPSTTTSNRNGMLSIDRMKEGLQHMIGTHDFRNFCKMDVEKVYNFVRTVHAADIVVTSTLETTVDICYLQIVGQAFLWHQIRCIVHVLFLIGRGYEEPSIVLELLNIEKYPGKPSYPLADERPLVLHECHYSNLSLGYSVANLWNILTVQEQQWEEHILAAARIRNCTDNLKCKMVRIDELLVFAASKLQQRMKKQRGTQIPQLTKTLGSPPASSSGTISWREALSWLETNDIVPDPSKLVECVYTPLLQRSKGTTYEEKVSSIQQKEKRQQKYESNVIKKRKTKEEDASFYNLMSHQGGSSL